MADTDSKSSSDAASRSNEGGNSDRASEARESLSDKSREALSGDTATAADRDAPATAADRAAGQDRMAAESQAAKTRVETEARVREATSGVTETAQPAPEATPTELGQLPEGALAPSLRDQMIAEAGGAANLDPPQRKEIDDFLASPEGIEAARQYDFARGLEVSNLSEAQSMEAMRHFTAGRDVTYDDAGRIQLDSSGRVQTAEPILVADASGATALDTRTNAEVAADYARGLNDAVQAVAESRFAWAAGVAFNAVALAAGGPIRFAISRTTGLAVGAAGQRAIEWAAGLIAPRTGLSEADVTELAIAGGTILGFAAGAVTWRSIRRDLFSDLATLRHNTADRVRGARTAALDEFRGREITEADLTNDTLAGHRNAGPQTPHFNKWLENGGRIRMLDDGSLEYSRRIDLLGDGVLKDVSVVYREGFPDFTPFTTHPSGVTSVRIANMVGDHDTDYRAANLAAGTDWGRSSPDGWSWHHHEDGETMMLVPTELNLRFSHLGGAAVARSR